MPDLIPTSTCSCGVTTIEVRGARYVEDHAGPLVIRRLSAVEYAVVDVPGRKLARGETRVRRHECSSESDPAPSSHSLPGIIGAAADRAERAIGRVEDPGQRNALRVTLAILMLVVVMFGVVWAAARVASADCREDVLYWRSRYEHLVEALLAKDTALGIELLDEVSDAACARGDCGRALMGAR